MKKFRSLMLAAALMGLSSVTSYAATTAYYDIRFGGKADSYSGDAAIGNTGDYWNIMSTQKLADGSTGTKVPQILTDTKGKATLATLTFNYTADRFINNDTDETGFKKTKYAELMSNYIYSYLSDKPNSAFDTVTFSGLEASKDYGIYVLTQSERGDEGDGQKLKLTINGTDYVQSVASDGGASSFIEGQNYLKFDAKTDAFGKLAINYSSALPLAHSPMNRAVINGIQVGAAVSAPTPEPASMLLLGVGGALVIGKQE
jgi:hypothetical protein